MARKTHLAKRVWQFETLERRCMLAADLPVIGVAIHSSLPAFEQHGVIYTVAVEEPDGLSALVNERIQRMEVEAPENVAAFVVELQGNTGPTGRYATDQALEELYNKFVSAPPGSLNPPAQPLDIPSVDYIWDVEAHAVFTSKLNESIARVGQEAPANQSGFIMELQTQLAGADAGSFQGNTAALDELTNQYLSGGEIQRNSWPQADAIGATLLSTFRNDLWMVGVTGRQTIVYREIDSQHWQTLPELTADRMYPEYFLDGDLLVLRYEVATDSIYVNEHKEMLYNLRTGKIESIRDYERVAQPVREKAGSKWSLSGTEMGMFATLRESESLLDATAWALDFLPDNFFSVRSEFTDSPDIALIQGLSTDKPLEYRTLKVDLLNRKVLADEVTDPAGGGFIAKRTGPYFYVQWQMETDYYVDPAKHSDWPFVRFQQANDDWVVQAGPSWYQYYKRTDEVAWRKVGLPDAFFYAHHYQIQGNQLVAFGRGMPRWEQDTYPARSDLYRLVINLDTDTIESYTPIAEEDIQPTNLTMETFQGGGPATTRRTPDVPYGYFELPYLSYHLPGLQSPSFPTEELSIEWVVESVEILQWPEPAPMPTPLAFTEAVLVKVPGGEPLKLTFGATISDYDLALQSLEQLKDYLPSDQLQTSAASASTTNPDPLNNVQPGDNRLGIELGAAELFHSDLRHKKTKMQLGVTQV